MVDLFYCKLFSVSQHVADASRTNKPHVAKWWKVDTSNILVLCIGIIRINTLEKTRKKAPLGYCSFVADSATGGSVRLFYRHARHAEPS